MFNWFSLDKIQPDNQHHVMRYIETINTIGSIDFEKHIRTTIDKMKIKGLALESCNLEIDNKKIEHIINICKENQTYHPIITFHGTSDIDALRSILQYGYVMPGEVNQITGKIHKYRVGKMYGDGIYTSSNLMTAANYCEFDQALKKYLVINITLLGNIEQIPLNVSYKYDPLGTHANVTTTISYGMEFVISRKTTNVVPIGSILLRTSATGGSYYYNLGGNLHFKIHDLTKIKTHGTINFCRVMNDYYVIDHFSQTQKLLSSTISTPTSIKTNHFIIVPLHFLSNHLYAKIIDNFIISKQNVIIIIYDSKKSMIMQKKSHKKIVGLKFESIPFEPLAQFVRKTNIKNKSGNLVLILHDLLTLLDQFNNKELNIMHFIFDAKCTNTNNIKEICQQYEMYLEHPTIMVRAIYVSYNQCKVDHTCDAIRNTYYLKCLDNISDRVYTHTDRFLFECKNGNELVQLFRLFSEEVIPNINAYSYSYRIPNPLGTYGEGFVTQLTELPAWNIWNVQGSQLFKGKPPKYLWFNEKMMSVSVTDIDNINNIDNKDADEDKNKEHNNFIHDQIMSQFVETIIKLFAKFKNKLIVDPYLYRLHNHNVTLTQFTNNLMNLLDKYISSGHHIDKIKYLYNYVQNVINEINLYSSISIQFDGTMFERLKQLKFANRITKRIVHHLDKNHPDDQHDLQLNARIDPIVLSNCHDITGYACQIVNTDASCIDPWLIIVKKVSPIKLSIADVYNYREFGYVPNTLQSSLIIDFKWNGIIVIDNYDNDNNNNEEKKHTLQTKAFMAYQYTNNHHVIIPNQKLALTTSALVSILEHILLYVKFNNRKNIAIDRQYIAQQLEIAGNIIKCIRYNGIKYNDLYELLLRVPTLCETLGNKQLVPSIAMVLGILGYKSSQSSQSDLFESDQYENLMRSIFMESLYRTVEVCMKIGKLDRRTVISKILSSPKYISTFFQNRLISTSPFTVVSFLAYCEMIYQKKTSEEMIDAFAEYKISVMNFFERYFPKLINEHKNKHKNEHKNEHKNTTTLQTALVLMSIDRLQITQDFDANHVINHYTKNLADIEKEIMELRQKQETTKNAMLAKSHAKHRTKINKFIETNQMYITSHTKLPRIFSQKEIDILNQKRKPDNQLERLNNGLLKHHCCFEECPDYLKSFATDKDIVNNTRYGIFAHFKINMLMNNYYRGIHRHAKILCDKHDTHNFKQNLYKRITRKCAIIDNNHVLSVIDNLYGMYCQ